MMPARLLQTDTASSPFTVLRPSLNRLTNAWAKACATHPDVAALAATAPRMRALSPGSSVSPAPKDWVLQGQTTGGGVVFVCIAPREHLRVLEYAAGHIEITCLHIPLADLEGEA